MFVYIVSNVSRSRDVYSVLVCLTYVDNHERLSWDEIEETYYEYNVVVIEQEGDCMPPKYVKVFAVSGYDSNAGLVSISLYKGGIDSSVFWHIQ